MKRIILLSVLAFTAFTTYGIISYYQNVDNIDINKLYETEDYSMEVLKEKEKATDPIPSAREEAILPERETKEVKKKKSPKVVYKGSRKEVQMNHTEFKKTAVVGQVETKQKKSPEEIIENEEITKLEAVFEEEVEPIAVYHHKGDEGKEKEEIESKRKRKLELSKFSRAPIDYEEHLPIPKKAIRTISSSKE